MLGAGLSRPHAASPPRAPMSMTSGRTFWAAAFHSSATGPEENRIGHEVLFLDVPDGPTTLNATCVGPVCCRANAPSRKRSVESLLPVRQGCRLICRLCQPVPHPSLHTYRHGFRPPPGHVVVRTGVASARPDYSL